MNDRLGAPPAADNSGALLHVHACASRRPRRHFCIRLRCANPVGNPLHARLQHTQRTMDFMNKAMTAVTDVVVGVQTATGTDDGFGFTQNADGVFVRQRVEL